MQLFVVLCDEVLCVVRAVEVLALRVFAGPRVVPTDDEVGCAKVLADDGVPDGFARACHSHGEGKEGEVAHAVGIFGHDGLVYTYPSVVIDVARLGETDDGVDEDVGLTLTRCTDGELAVRSVHRVTCLECDDFAPGDFLEVRSELSGCVYR